MKKLFLFFMVALMSVSMFAAKDVVPSDAVLADYYQQGDVCVCFYVPSEMNCNDIVLTGSFNGWKSTAAECVKVEAVEGYDGWYVGSFEAEAEPDAAKGIQAKPIMLDVEGKFNWEYQVGAATAIRGGVQVVQGSYAGEIDLLNYGADAPNVFTVDAWKQNPCTAIYHNYTITVVSDGCDGLVIPFLVGTMNNWTFQQMPLDMDKTQANQAATYSISFKAAEGSYYQILSGLMDPQTGKVDSMALPSWNDEAYMQQLVDGVWDRIAGEDGANQVTHEEPNIVWDLRVDSLRWARCAPAEPAEYTIIGVNFPKENAPEAIEIIGDFDEWRGTAMELLNTGWYFVELDVKASQQFKFRGAGSWDQELEVYDAENDEWIRLANFEFGQLWSDDTYKGTPCKWIELDLSDASIYRWSTPEPPAEPKEYVVLAVNLPTKNCPEAVEIIGSFDDWQGTTMELLNTGWHFIQLQAKATQEFKFRGAGSWDQVLEVYDAENDEWISLANLEFGQLWSDDTYKGDPCKWIELDLSDASIYRWSFDDPSVKPGPFAISVTDNSLDDWNQLPSGYVARAYCPSDAQLLALKSVQVFADLTYINILVEPNMDELPDLEYVPFHVFFDTDNSDLTGGYGDIFTDPNADILLEGGVFIDGQPYNYNPAVFKWWGEVGADGWEWVDPNVQHDSEDFWGALIGEGQLPIASSQFVDGKIEIQILRELIPANWNMNEFGIGFNIQQSWVDVGILPCAHVTAENPQGRAAKMKVKVHQSSPLPPSAVIYEAVIDGINYRLNADDTTATVIAKDGGYSGSITIPAQVFYKEQTYKVEGIGMSAFRGCIGLTSVTIPNSVSSIGQLAFAGCTGLTSLEIPNSVINCGMAAFYGCSNLVSIKAPAVVFADTWDYSIALEHICITAGYMPQALYYILSSRSLKTIDLAAVEDTELADNMFIGSDNLQKIVLPAKLTNINYMLMAQCIRLESVVIPAGVTEIKDRAFEDCRSLGSVEFAGKAVKRIGDWSFYNCHELANIAIPEGVTEIGKAAFYGCAYATAIHLPASLQSIGDNGFAGCAKMAQMTVDAVVPPTVEPKTFDEVSTVAPVYVPDESVAVYQAHPVWGKLNIIGKDAPRGIEDVQTNGQFTKVLRDGQIVILRGDKIYTLTGQEVK